MTFYLDPDSLDHGDEDHSDEAPPVDYIDDE